MKASQSLLLILVLLMTLNFKAYSQLTLAEEPTPKLFLTDLSNEPYNMRDIAFTLDEEEVYFTIENVAKKVTSIVYLKKKEGKWIGPFLASFSGQFRDIEPAFSADGKKLFFASNRPLTQESVKAKDYDIWVVERLENGQWGMPKNLGAPVNTLADEFYPSVAANGNLYFTSEREGAVGKEDIFMSRLQGASYQQPEALPVAVNSKTYEFNAFISPKEDMLIFSSYGRADDLGGSDLYVSFKDQKGSWLPAINLGSDINSSKLDYCPYFNFSQNRFYFTSERVKEAQYNKKATSYQELIEVMNKVPNGLSRLYYIDGDMVLSLKKALLPNKEN